MLYKPLLSDPDTRTAGTIVCPDICLTTLGAADILLVFFDMIYIYIYIFTCDRSLFHNRLFGIYVQKMILLPLDGSINDFRSKLIQAWSEISSKINNSDIKIHGIKENQTKIETRYMYVDWGGSIFLN